MHSLLTCMRRNHIEGVIEMKRLHSMSKVIIVIASILILFFLIIRQTIPKHPQLQYVVDSFEELTEKIATKPLIRMPNQDALPSFVNGYEVYLVSRFSDEVDGYHISIMQSFEIIKADEPSAQDEKPQDIHISSSLGISCEGQSKYEDEIAAFLPNKKIAGKDVFESEFGDIIWYLDGYRYAIEPSKDIKDSLKEYIIPIAESILKQPPK